MVLLAALTHNKPTKTCPIHRRLKACVLCCRNCPASSRSMQAIRPFMTSRSKTCPWCRMATSHMRLFVGRTEDLPQKHWGNCSSHSLRPSKAGGRLSFCLGRYETGLAADLMSKYERVACHRWWARRSSSDRLWGGDRILCCGFGQRSPTTTARDGPVCDRSWTLPSALRS